MSNLIEIQALKNLTDNEKLLFQTEYLTTNKSASTGFLLAFFLGIFGGHHWYFRNKTLGIIYIIFSWTGVPAVLGFFESLFQWKRAANYNNNLIGEIVEKIKSLRSDAESIKDDSAPLRGNSTPLIKSEQKNPKKFIQIIIGICIVLFIFGIIFNNTARIYITHTVEQKINVTEKNTLARSFTIVKKEDLTYASYRKITYKIVVPGDIKKEEIKPTVSKIIEHVKTSNVEINLFIYNDKNITHKTANVAVVEWTNGTYIKLNINKNLESC